MQFVPLNNYVIVKKLEGSVKTGSGIILTTSGDSDRARVVAIPDEVSTRMNVECGATLLIRWSQALKIDDQYFAVDAKDIVTQVID